MKNRMSSAVVWPLVAAAAALATSANAANLKVGVAAPPLKVAKWVKGTPITSFQHGKVAWIGHPMMGLDKVLPQVIAGKFDAAAAAKEREDKEAEGKKVQAEVQKAMSLISSGKTEDGFKILDDLVARHPEYKMGV